MNIFILDPNELALNLAMRFMDEGHKVKMYIPPNPSLGKSDIGEGIVDRVHTWKDQIPKADLTIITDNSMYQAELEPFFEKGYPIVGANKRSAQLELERDVGQDLLKRYGVKVAHYEVFKDYNSAIAYVKDNADKTFVSKPWGGTGDKDLSYVSKSAADMVYMLESWKRLGPVKRGFMLQAKIDGYEMAVGGWFGKHGWCRELNENWEEKRQMNDGLGENTGEMGTIMRYVRSSKLFEETLEPVTDYLLAHGYIGYVDMNCIIDKSGRPWPLEFTMRFGWPHVQIAMMLHKGDFAQSLAGLLNGHDLMNVTSKIACGVVMLRPNKADVIKAPIYGLTVKNMEKIALQNVTWAKQPMMVGNKVINVGTYCVANEQVLVACGTGDTVKKASEEAYKIAWQINWPGNRAFRTDIGKHMEKHLPKLQQFGYALDMQYD